MTVKETLEALTAIDAVVDAATPFIEGEKQINFLTAILLVSSLGPALTVGLQGLESIPDEVKDLDPDEAKQLATVAIPLVKKIARLFSRKEVAIVPVSDHN